MLNANGYIIPLIDRRNGCVNGTSRDMSLSGTCEWESSRGFGMEYVVNVTVPGAAPDGSDAVGTIRVSDEDEFVHEMFLRAVCRWVERNTVARAVVA